MIKSEGKQGENRQGQKHMSWQTRACLVKGFDVKDS